ncbi:MAG: gliding motility protein GldM [Bacteroidales bacterium]|nr:gliding motility protein GldM [Bacteroidales bacterium]MCD8394305.1 gliding motility protein GldM [Bacteroidales bacterium]
MGSNTTRLSPRQKMINLMYIVLTAMLALNVSSDVLDGFSQVDDGLNRSNKNVAQRNDALLASLQAFADQNPDKGLPWYEKAKEVRRVTDELYHSIDSLKGEIVRQADGAKGNINDILNREDLEAAAVIMLNPANPKGALLRHNIDSYRAYIASLMTDSVKRASVEQALSTAPVRRKGVLGAQSWEESKFDNQPVVAAITLLSKLQNDIRYAEGEALATLLANVDAGDVRVNELNAFVIPQSRMVMRGSKYSANIVLAAVDTTQRPIVYVNGNRLANDLGIYELVTGATGTFDYKGYLEVPHGDGTVTRHDFSSSYTVIEPTATVSATMMNVLYAGIDNPISISVPGVAMNNVSATMTNGTLTRNGDHWVAHPSKVGAEAVITVTANMDGRQQTVATTAFRVRKLPDPTPYLPYKDDKGNTDRYKGGKPISKTLLMATPGIEAAIDDDLLNIKFKVLSFETVFFDSMGNAIPEVSNGDQFSQRQKDSFRRLSRGKRFYISRVKAVGPDGITRDLAPLEVIVN